jgi:hypothetical protein
MKNPFAETRRPYQIWGVPTQKDDATSIINGSQVKYQFEWLRRIIGREGKIGGERKQKENKRK